MDKLIFQIRKELYKRRRDLNKIILTICAVVCVIVSGVIYKSVFKPLKDKYIEQMELITLYNNNIKALPDLSLNSEIMNQMVNDISDIYSKMNDIVPDRRNVPFVTSQISLAAANNKVEISSMQKDLDTTVTIGEDTFGVVKYNLTCFSTYENIVNFLATLETSNSIFAIEKVNIGPLSEDEEDSQRDSSYVKTTLIINIYMKSNK